VKRAKSVSVDLGAVLDRERSQVRVGNEVAATR
jgi:hypothetical protein